MTVRRSGVLARLIVLLLRDSLAMRNEIVNPRTDSKREFRARQARDLIEKLGPFYIKMGQVLATRPDFVSSTMMKELATLNNKVTVAPFSVFAPVLDDELGMPWRKYFKRLDTRKPLGSASLAQVYEGVTHDGRHVVAKIQRPGTAQQVYRDMALLRRIARLAANLVPKLNAVIDMETTLEFVFDAMRPELDFQVEAANMRIARRLVADFTLVSVPEVVMATPRLLVQTLAPGKPINQLDLNEFSAQQRRLISNQLLGFMYRGYFTDGMFHADPHPGNIFVCPRQGATIIDWGMIGRLDRHMSLLGLLLITSLLQNDANSTAKAWIELGRATAWADVSGFTSDMVRLVPKIAASTMEELNFGTALISVLRHSSKRHIRASPLVGIFAKSFANIEGSIRFLAPEISVLDAYAESMLDIMFHLAKDALSGEQTMRYMLDLIMAGNTTAEHTRSLLRDLSNRDLTVKVDMIRGERRSRESVMVTARRVVLVAACALAAWGIFIR